MTTVTMESTVPQIRNNQLVRVKTPPAAGSSKTGNFPRWVAEVGLGVVAAKLTSFIGPETIIIIITTIDLLLRLSIFLNIQRVHIIKHQRQKTGQQKLSLPRTYWPSIGRSQWVTRLMEMNLV